MSGYDASKFDPDWKQNPNPPDGEHEPLEMQIQGLCRPSLGVLPIIRLYYTWSGPIGWGKLADMANVIVLWAHEHSQLPANEMPDVIVEAWPTTKGKSILYSDIPVTAETWAELIQK